MFSVGYVNGIVKNFVGLPCEAFICQDSKDEGIMNVFPGSFAELLPPNEIRLSEAILTKLVPAFHICGIM